jgi:hypothetical protein
MTKSKILTIAAIAAIALLLISNAFTVYFLIAKKELVKKPVPVENVLPSESNIVSGDIPSTTSESVIEQNPAQTQEETVVERVDDSFLLSKYKRPEDVPSVLPFDSVYSEGGAKVVLPAGAKALDIYWYKKASSTPVQKFFNSKYKTISNLAPADYNKLFNNSDLPKDFDYNTDTYPTLYYWYDYVVGVVGSSSDKYAGKEVFNVGLDIVDCEGPGCGSTVFSGLVIADEEGGRLIVLSRYSSIGQGESAAVAGFDIFTKDDSAYIAEVENPEFVEIPGSKYRLKRSSANYEPLFNSSGVSGDFVATAANGKKVYVSDNGCFYVYNQNGSIVMYEMEYPMVVGGYSTSLDFTFNDGVKNESDYIGREQGGCGSFGCARLLKANSADLVAVGKFANDDNVYEFTYESFLNSGSSTHPLSAIYDDAYFFDGGKPDFETFSRQHPLVLWKLPIKDYYLGFLKADYVQIAECGKPVIYLYPEKETDVKVQVKPNGGFSVTDPIYGLDGWFVRADTKSNLYNYANGQNYSYLFWEGKAVFYERPTQGFVVAREDVGSFLDEKLAKLGMVGQEITDFKDFWVPRMTEKPYYFVTFLPKTQFDQLAPMKVTPRPDTVIRVFMDYQGLDNPIDVEEPVIKTPARKGFTVVEWGGALNRN